MQGNKNQPIEGLIIVNGLTQEGEAWTDGEIMDLPMASPMIVPCAWTMPIP